MKTKTIPSAVSNSTPAACSGFTLGLDLGDRSHHICELDASVQIVPDASLANTRHPIAACPAAVPNPPAESLHENVELPAAWLPVVQPLLPVLAEIRGQIKAMERELVRRSKTGYPATQRLQQITGVGPLTALCFVLKIGDPQRFSRSRDVGPYLGLCPRRDQSGDTDKQLRISKCGDGLLRRLLVTAPHYILGPLGP